MGGYAEFGQHRVRLARTCPKSDQFGSSLVDIGQISVGIVLILVEPGPTLVILEWVSTNSGRRLPRISAECVRIAVVSQRGALPTPLRGGACPSAPPRWRRQGAPAQPPADAERRALNFDEAQETPAEPLAPEQAQPPQPVRNPFVWGGAAPSPVLEAPVAQPRAQEEKEEAQEPAPQQKANMEVDLQDAEGEAERAP